METHLLTASPRSTTGKGAARSSRRVGQTPGVLYRAGGSATPINFDVAALSTIFRKTADSNTVVNVAIDGQAHTCLVREVQRNPVSRQVVHVDFYEVAPDYMVTVDVVVNAVGRAVGTRAGGVLRSLSRVVTVKCAAGQIPSKLDVDVTSLDVGQFVRASTIVPPVGVQIVYMRDFNVLTVEGKQKSPAEAAAAAPAAGAAAKPAAAKPAAAKPAAAAAAKPAAAKPAAKK